MAKDIKIGGIKVDVALGVGRIEQDVKELNSTLGREFNQIKKNLKSALTLVGAAAALGGTIFAVKKLQDAMFGLANAGEAAGSVRTQFLALGGSISTIDDARKATLGMVDSFKLMELANRSLIADIPEVNKNFATMADFGVRLANTLNVTAEEGIAKVSEAIKSASTDTLINIGLLVDQEKAFQRYAASLGKEVQALSEVEKVQARRIAALDLMSQKTERLSEVTESLSNANSAVAASMRDALGVIGIQVNESAALASQWREVANAIDEVNWAQVGKVVAGAFEQISFGIAGAIPLIEDFVRGLDVLFNFSATSQLVELTKEIEDVEEALAKAQNTSAVASRAGFLAFAIQTKGSKELSKELEGLNKKRDELIAQIKDETRQVKRSERAHKARGDAATGAAQKSGRELQIEKTKAEQAAKAVENLRNQWSEHFNSLERNVLEEGLGAIIGLGSLQDFDRQMQLITENFGQSLEEETLKALEAGVFESEEAVDRYKKLMTDRFLEPFYDRWDEAEKERQDKQLREAAGFWDGFFGTFTDVGGKAAEGWTEKLGADLQDTITGALRGAVAVAVEGGSFRPVITDAITGGADAAAAALGIPLQVGTILSPAISAMVDEIARVGDKIFGGTKDFDEASRDSVERWIEDRIREASEAGRPFSTFGTGPGGQRGFGNFGQNVVFGDIPFGQGDFVQTNLDRFDEQSRGAFNALGAGLTEFLGTAGDVGGQVGIILQENLVGNLDNARLLLDTLGVSVGDLEEALLDAGKAGTITWQAFETHMQNLNDLSGEGLIGVGDLEGAFLQLESSGGRGMQAIISLQNLALEAIDLNIASVDQLGEHLVQAGIVSQEEWSKWAEILQARGIANMEQLRDSSDRALGGIIADLDSNVALFTEWADMALETADNINDISQAWDGVPTEWTTNYRVKVDVSGDPIPDDLARKSGLNSTFARMGSAGVDLSTIDSDASRTMRTAVFNIDARGGTPGIEGRILETIRAHAQSAAAEAIRRMNAR